MSTYIEIAQGEAYKVISVFGHAFDLTNAIADVRDYYGPDDIPTGDFVDDVAQVIVDARPDLYN